MNQLQMAEKINSESWRSFQTYAEFQTACQEFLTSIEGESLDNLKSWALHTRRIALDEGNPEWLKATLNWYKTHMGHDSQEWLKNPRNIWLLRGAGLLPQ